MKGGENIIEPSWSFLPRGAGPGRAGFVRSGLGRTRSEDPVSFLLLHPSVYWSNHEGEE
jgi:hypothetical protein